MEIIAQVTNINKNNYTASQVTNFNNENNYAGRKRKQIHAVKKKNEVSHFRSVAIFHLRNRLKDENFRGVVTFPLRNR